MSECYLCRDWGKYETHASHTPDAADQTVTECCGEIVIRYRRSVDGRVVHRADCTRQGRTSVDWHYAATSLDNDHGRVLAEIGRLPWLHGCSYCMHAEEGR